MHIGVLGTIIMIINLILSIVLIFFERRNPSVTLAWLLVLTFFPIVGFLAYLIFGQNLSRQKIFNNKLIDDEKKKDYFSKVKKEYRFDLDTIGNMDLIKMNYKNTGSLYTQNNSVKLFFEGEEKFTSLFRKIKEAKKFIHMEYYIIEKDIIGKELINILTKKAKEGIEVKLLFDGMGSYKLNNKKILGQFIKAGGKFAVFFPNILPYINKRINYRNHRKIVVIDGKSGFLGGFNVGDEYLSRDKKIGYWRDTHILIEGEGVRELEERFLLDWSYASGENVKNYNKYFYESYELDTKIGMQIVSSGPDHKEPYIRNVYLKIINNAKQYVYIQSPYFVPDDTILSALKLSALSGVDVRIMIPGKPDHKFMGWAANSYIGELLDTEVKVYFYNKGFIHSKTIVADDSVCSVGTANMDIRSFRLNFETNCVIYNNNISKKMYKKYIEDIGECKRITKDEYKNRGRFSKIAESVVRLLSPIL